MLSIHIDPEDFRRLVDEFDATPAQITAAWRRALARTSRRLRTQARKHLRVGLGLRAAKYLKARVRLRQIRGSNSMGAATVWVGLNDMPVRAFRGGRPRQTASGVSAAGRDFSGAFLGRGRDSDALLVFRRKGRARLPIYQETIPIKEQGDAIIEAEVMAEANDFLLKTFAHEIKARTIYGVGQR